MNDGMDNRRFFYSNVGLVSLKWYWRPLICRNPRFPKGDFESSVFGSFTASGVEEQSKDFRELLEEPLFWGG